MYVKKMAKKMAVPISDGLVETLSSLGTGIKENMSTFLRIFMQKLGCSAEIMD